MTALERRLQSDYGRMLNNLRQGNAAAPPVVGMLEAFKISVETDEADWPVSFAQVLHALGIFGDVYPQYQLYSQVAHPSLYMALEYLRFEVDAVRVANAPLWDVGGDALQCAAECQCLANLAFDRIWPGILPFRDELAELSSELQVSLPGGGREHG